MTLSYKHLAFPVPVRLLLLLKRRMRYLRAAGCIVTDDRGNMLLIRRNGRWDLPKGKVEPGETLLQAALRETAEETGIKVIVDKSTSQRVNKSTSLQVNESTSLKSKLKLKSKKVKVKVKVKVPIKTYHLFNLYGGWHLKQTSWFRARAVGVMPVGTPQREEGISRVAWVSPDLWHSRLRHSYGTLRTLSFRSYSNNPARPQGAALNQRSRTP